MRLTAISRARKCHPQSSANRRAFEPSAWPPYPLGVNYGFPRAILAPLHRGAKGVAVVTCPWSAGLEPAMPSPLRRRSRGLSRSASRRGLTSVHRRALPEAQHGQQSTRPALDAAPVPAILWARGSPQRAVVFALLGSPRAFAHQLDTALDFRSGADPCEWMALRLQNRSTRWREARPRRRCPSHAPEAGRHHHPHGCRNARMGRINPFRF